MSQSPPFSGLQRLLAYASGSFAFAFIGMTGFLVPLRAQELGAPLAVIGLIVGANSVLSIVVSVPAGALCDRIGGKRLYVSSTVACGVGVLLLALTDSYWVMFLVELVFGFPRTTVWIASQAYVTSMGGPEERATLASRLSFSSSMGALAAPLLMGASAEVLGFQASFGVVVPFAALYTLIGLMLPDVRGVGPQPPGVLSRSEAGAPGPPGPEAPPATSAEAPARGEQTTPSGVGDGPPRNEATGPRLGRALGYGAAADLLRVRGMQIAMVLTFVRIWILVGWFTFFRVLLAQNGFSPLLIGSVETASNVVTIASSLAGGWASRAFSKEVATAVALAISGVGVALSPPLAFVPAVYLAGGLVGIGNGVTLPLLLALIADSTPGERRGLAMGMRTSANRLASAAAPTALGVLMTPLGIPAGLVFSTVLSWVALALTVWWHRWR